MQETSTHPNEIGPHTTISGRPVQTVYDFQDISEMDPESHLGKPGEFPFTRGVHKEMYRKRLWTMRQFAGFGSARQTNERFKFLLERGQSRVRQALAV